MKNSSKEGFMSKQEERRPSIRFKGYTEPWEQRKLGEVAERVTRKNKNLESELPLTISAQHGLINQETFFNKKVASKDVSGYYLLKKGEFAYNKSYSSDYPWGAVKRLDNYEMGVLSTLYIVFRPNSIDSDFLAVYYDSPKWHKEVSMRAAEGARNHGLLNISPQDFFDTELMFPVNHSEQAAIGSFFQELDQLITLQQRELELMKEGKKTLLSKMFPKDGENFPEIRFPGFTNAWEQRKLGEISTSFSGGTPVAGNKRYYGGEIPFIRSAEINSDSTELFLTNEGLENSSAKLVKKGDILYALYGATSGEVDISKINGAINQAILCIVPKINYNSGFIMQWLKYQKKNITDKYLQGGQGNLSGTLVKELDISLPTLPEQKAIGSFFQELDKLITLQQRELEILKTMKSTLLKAMFA